MAAYVLQQRIVAPITPGDGALVGLMAGIAGAFVSLLLSIPISFIVGPMERPLALEELLAAGGRRIGPAVVGFQEESTMIEHLGRTVHPLGLKARGGVGALSILPQMKQIEVARMNVFHHRFVITGARLFQRNQSIGAEQSDPDGRDVGRPNAKAANLPAQI